MHYAKTTRTILFTLGLMLTFLGNLSAEESPYRVLAVNLSTAPVSIRMGEGSSTWESAVLAPRTASKISDILTLATFQVWNKTGTAGWQTQRNKDGKTIKYRAVPGSIHLIVVDANGLQVRSVASPSGTGPAISFYNAGTLPASIQVGAAWNQGTIINSTGLAAGELSRFAQLTRLTNGASFWTDTALPAGLSSWSVKDKDGKLVQSDFAMGRAYLLVIGLPGTVALTQPEKNGVVIDLGSY